MIKPHLPNSSRSFSWGEYAEGLFGALFDLAAMYGWRIVFTVATIYILKPYIQRWLAARSLAQALAPERVRVLDAGRARAREEQTKKLSSNHTSVNSNINSNSNGGGGGSSAKTKAAADKGSTTPKAFPSSTFER